MTYHYCDVCKKQVKSWKDLVLINYDVRETKFHPDIAANVKPKGRIEMCADCFTKHFAGMPIGQES